MFIASQGHWKWSDKYLSTSQREKWSLQWVNDQILIHLIFCTKRDYINKILEILYRRLKKNIRDSRMLVDKKSIWFRAELNFCLKISAGRQGCIAEKEVWERRTHRNDVPTPNINEDWFAYKNFYAGSSCFTIVLRYYTRDNLSFTHLRSSRRYT